MANGTLPKSGKWDEAGTKEAAGKKSTLQTKLDLIQQVHKTPTTPRGRHLLHNLVFHYNARTGQCNPSHKTLAEETGYSERTVRKILKDDLVGLVAYHRGKHSNNYVLFPPMIVTSPVPGAYAVAHVESTLGTRGPGGNDVQEEHGGRFTRNTGAGSLGIRGPGNLERTEKEPFVVGQKQKSSTPKKRQGKKPTLEAVQKAFRARGFSLGKAEAEAERFMAYNEEKGWRMGWEKAVERWTPQTSVETAEYKPAYHKPFKPFQHEERTPESEARVLAGFKDLKQALQAKLDT